MRINKYVALCGAASRRGADALIAAGRVMINGRVAAMGDDVDAADEVTLDGELLTPATERVVLAYNKPVGVVCSAVSQARDEINIIDAVGYDGRLFTVGRLDKESCGLILLTNDGELADRVMRAGNGHEKEYLVTVDKDVTDNFLRSMSEGVRIRLDDGRDYVTKCCVTAPVSERRFRIILTEGKKRQIRRMCSALGYKTRSLERVRIMNLVLDGIERGSYRRLSEEEIKSIMGKA